MNKVLRRRELSPVQLDQGNFQPLSKTPSTPSYSPLSKAEESAESGEGLPQDHPIPSVPPASEEVTSSSPSCETPRQEELPEKPATTTSVVHPMSESGYLQVKLKYQASTLLGSSAAFLIVHVRADDGAVQHYWVDTLEDLCQTLRQMIPGVARRVYDRVFVYEAVDGKIRQAKLTKLPNAFVILSSGSFPLCDLAGLVEADDGRLIGDADLEQLEEPEVVPGPAEDEAPAPDEVYQDGPGEYEVQVSEFPAEGVLLGDEIVDGDSPDEVESAPYGNEPTA